MFLSSPTERYLMSEVIPIGLLAKALGCFVSHRVHSDFSLFLYMGKLKKGDRHTEMVRHFR